MGYSEIERDRERERDGEMLSTHSLRLLVYNQQACSTRKTWKDRSIGIIRSHGRNDRYVLSGCMEGMLGRLVG